MQNIVTLGQINDALKITSVTASQLAEMGFAALENKPICEALPPEESRRLRNAKLYQADSIVQIRVALAKRLAAPASCLHQIQEPPTKTEALAHYSQQAILAMGEAAPAVNRQLETKPAFYTAIAEQGGKWIPLPEYAAQTDIGVLKRVVERAREEGWIGDNAMERLKELGWACRPVYFAADPAQVAPLPLLVRDVARELGITCADACIALKPLGNFSVNSAVTAEMASKLRECFPEAAPSAVAVLDAEKLLRAEATRLERIYGSYGNKWYGFCTEKASHLEHLRVADALAATPAAAAPMVDMTPPATSRDRWMYEQGRLAERDARTHGSVAADAPAALDDEDLIAVPRGLLGAARAVIARKADAPSVLEKLRRYTTGDLSAEAKRRVLTTAPAAAAPVVLPEPDAALLNQGIELLHAISCDERNRGNCSAAEGATASADAVQRLAVTLLAGVSAPAAQAVEPRYTWTGTEADDAMLLLGRMDDSLEPERIAQLEQIVPRLGARINALTAQLAAPQAQADARDADDAALVEWLSGQYLAADFHWGDPKTPVLVIEIPPTASVCGDFRTDVRSAIAAQTTQQTQGGE